jgi:hypothetical protein
MAFIDKRCSGFHDHQDAEKARRDGRQFDAGEFLSQEHRGDQGTPDRHGEFDRDDLGQRDEKERRKPGILRAVMDDIADDVEAEIAEAQAEIALMEDDRYQDRHGNEASKDHNDKDRNVMSEFATGDGEGERIEKPSRHPDGGFSSRLLRQTRFSPLTPDDHRWGIGAPLGRKGHINLAVEGGLDGREQFRHFAAP